MAQYVWPSDIGIAELKLSINQNRAVFESVFTRQKQVVTLNSGSGDRWEGVCTTAVLSNFDAQKALGFLARVGIYENEILLPHPDYAGPREGANTGSGAGGSGRSLTGTFTGPYYQGEYLEVNSEFKVITADYSGGGTIEIAPAFHATPTGSIDFATPQLRVWLTSSPQVETDDLKFGTATFSFEEVIP